jgi:hypothetical protein
MYSAAIGSRLDLAIGPAAGVLALFLACVPAWLAVRHALRCRRAASERPRLRLLDGRSVDPRRATWSMPRFRQPVRT